MIAELLHVGRENGTSRTELARITGLDEREVRRLIRAERLAGAVIISGNDGYFLPADEHDIRMFARSMSHRAGEIYKVSRAAEEALARTEGQEVIEEWF